MYVPEFTAESQIPAKPKFGNVFPVGEELLKSIGICSRIFDQHIKDTSGVLFGNDHLSPNERDAQNKHAPIPIATMILDPIF